MTGACTASGSSPAAGSSGAPALIAGASCVPTAISGTAAPITGSSGASGMVVGEFAMMKNKTAKLTFLADGAQIFEGDEVLTSGSGGAFPAGLSIGTISNVQTEAGGQIEYGIVVPQVELDALVQVFIIKDFAPVE